MANPHQWQPSKLGHGNTQCRACLMTDMEAAALGCSNDCPGPMTRQQTIARQIYLAAPFFNHEQLALVQAIESVVNKLLPSNVVLYSPRTDGVLQDMPAAERRKAFGKIFKLNTDNIDRSSLVVAVLNWRDTGTLWEMGYAYGKRIPTVSVTTEDAKPNVMLKQSVEAHFHSVENLQRGLQRWATKQVLPWAGIEDVRDAY